MIRSMENETAQDAGTEAVADNQTRGKIDRALPGANCPQLPSPNCHALQTSNLATCNAAFEASPTSFARDTEITGALTVIFTWGEVV